MVDFLYKYFNQDKFLVSLSKVSDSIYKDDGKKYIDFDIFKKSENCCNLTKGFNSLSSVDMLIINKEKKHLLLIEFKNMEHLKDKKEINKWIKDKGCSIKIKIPDSILLIGYFLKENGYSFDDFFKIKKSFIFVYKNLNSRSIINNHLKYYFTKYNFILKNSKISEADEFKRKFLN